MMAWAIYDENKQYILDYFVGKSTDCWRYVADKNYNCGKIGSLDVETIKRILSLQRSGWKCINGIWISPRSEYYPK